MDDDEDNEKYNEEINIVLNSYLFFLEFGSWGKIDKFVNRNNEIKNDIFLNERICKRFIWSLQCYLVLKILLMEEGYI